MVTIDVEGIKEDVYNRIQGDEYDLTERSASFLLGYHISQTYGDSTAFEIGWVGDIETPFSPDLDVLRLSDSLIGYEVKGYRGDTEKVNKQQMYKGLGQAVSLLNQPQYVEGGALKEVSLAYPSVGNQEWMQNFTEAVRETPVGLKKIGMDRIETVIEPDINPLYNEGLKKELVQSLEKSAKSSGRQHPRKGLRNLALKMAKDHTDSELFL
jgi:hypothetical protein